MFTVLKNVNFCTQFDYCIRPASTIRQEHDNLDTRDRLIASHCFYLGCFATEWKSKYCCVRWKW